MATAEAETDWLLVTGADLLLRTRVRPRASRSRAEGIESGRLRLRVAAAPVEGSANRAVLELLAELLDLPRSRIVLERGEHSRNKDFRLPGLAARRALVAAALLQASAGKP